MSFLKDVKRALKVAKRPDPKAYRTSLRAVFLGLSILGVLGFVFQLAGSALRMISVAPPSSDIMIIILAAVAAITLAVVLYLRSRY